ncbi:MAG: hypothetical protein Q4F05_17180 [bacterium]|nr:hypothetical protein [bacterium]
MISIKVEPKIIEAFHQMWDTFPGMARLIDKNHVVHAANESAMLNGYVSDICCVTVGDMESHKGCLAWKTILQNMAHVDRPSEQVIRGWMPVQDNTDLFVHFTLSIPVINE